MASSTDAGPASTTIGDLTFDAAFDSGNAARVEAVGIPASNSAAEEYNVWTSNDCAGTPHVKEYKVWFSFAVRACSSASAAPLSGRLLAFNIYNMNNLGKLFKHDMRPVYRYLPSKPKWARLHAPTSQTGTQKGDPNFVLSFKHRCECADGDSVQFAFCFPLSYSDSMARLAWLDALFGLPAASVLPPGIAPPRVIDGGGAALPPAPALPTALSATRTGTDSTVSAPVATPAGPPTSAAAPRRRRRPRRPQQQQQRGGSGAGAAAAATAPPAGRRLRRPPRPRSRSAAPASAGGSSATRKAFSSLALQPSGASARPAARRSRRTAGAARGLRGRPRRGVLGPPRLAAVGARPRARRRRRELRGRDGAADAAQGHLLPP